jgi:hypothetical protein
MTEYERAKAREIWYQIRSSQRDFFLTNEFLSGQIHKAEHHLVAYRIQRWTMMAILAMTTIILYFHSR